MDLDADLTTYYEAEAATVPTNADGALRASCVSVSGTQGAQNPFRVSWRGR
jgi:hypothetical protein